MNDGRAVGTLAELLLDRAADRGAATAYIYLDKSADGEVQRSLSYTELLRGAACIAQVLRQRVDPGARVLILMPPGLGFLEAFLGCMLAGVVAVPTFPPDPVRLDRTVARLHTIVTDCEPALVLCAQELLELLEGSPALAGPLGALPWIAPEGSDPGAREPGALSLGFGPDSEAFLQYTSGSTGQPRGVVLTHRNLLTNIGIINEAFGHNRDSRGVIWLPPYHDMGLIGGILAPLAAGFPVLLMSPLVMLQSPLRWLKAISSFGGTTSGGPNFAYELAVRRTTPEQRAGLDLSSWSVAFCGAEPIRAGTLARFVEAFAPAGFRQSALMPCYGLAEGTLMVTGQAKGEGHRALSLHREALGRGEAVTTDDADGTDFVSCGSPVGDWELRTVNPDTGVVAAPNTIGEIWLRGASVARGYWGKPEESQQVFGAHLASGEGPFLRTGDLGFVRDGCLYVAGRTKDLIIVRGRNLHAQDVERTVEACDRRIRSGCVAAFGLQDGGEEHLAVVAEVGRKVDLEAVEGAVRAALAAEHSAQVHALLLIEPRSLPKTSSGKVARSACRQAYLAGELPIMAEWRSAVPRTGGTSDESVQEPQVSAADILSRLRLGVAASTRKKPSEVPVDRPVLDLGLDSLGVAQLVQDLSEWLGREIPVAEALEHATVSDFAEAVAQRVSGSRAPVHEVEPRSPADGPEVAVVGLACRFPGAPDADATWEVLRQGRCTVDTPGGARSAVGRCAGPAGYLESIDLFDAGFFGVSPREAARIDPQQRLLLEVAWEALEDAGVCPQDLAGTGAGVFVGISAQDYAAMVADHEPDLHALTGSAMSMVANRLSHFLDLRGPSLAVDTACSSSLSAVHLACQSLRTGDADLSIAAGVNILLNESTSEALERASMLSPDSRCMTFDARANGYVRGEGCGAVILKRLRTAERYGDRIIGVIRGSGMTHGGRAPGVTVPRASAQESTLRKALATAGVAPGDVGLVEAHGTGTPLGDPVELQALSAVLDAEGGDQRCWVGSIKANLGHLESAAGLAGLIKVLLCMQRGEVPPQANFEEPTGAYRFDTSRLEVPRQVHDWPLANRIASVSSFGFGGANAHVVVDGTRKEAAVPAHQHPHVLVLSARTTSALDVLVDCVARALQAGSSMLPEVAHVAATGRQHFQHRLALVCDVEADAIAGLHAYLAGESRPGLHVSAPSLAPVRAVQVINHDLAEHDTGALSARHPFFAARMEQLQGGAASRMGAGVDTDTSADATRLALADLLVHLGVPSTLVVPEDVSGAEHPGGPKPLSSGACRTVAGLLAALHVRHAHVHWTRFYPGPKPRRARLPSYPFERKSHWIAPVVQAARQGSPQLEAAASPPLVQPAVAPLKGAPPGVVDMERALALVTEETAAVLQVDIEDVDPGIPLVELGMDSLLAIELQDRLEDALGLRLPMDDLIEEAMPSDVARLLVEAAAARERDAAQETGSPTFASKRWANRAISR